MYALNRPVQNPDGRNAPLRTYNPLPTNAPVTAVNSTAPTATVGGKPAGGVAQFNPDGSLKGVTTIQSAPGYLYGDPAIDAVTPDQYRANPADYFKSRGIGADDIAFILGVTSDNNVTWKAWWDNNVVGSLDSNNVYIYSLTDAAARSAAAKSWTPNQLVLEAQIDVLTEHQAAVAAASQPKPNPTPQPAPLPMPITAMPPNGNMNTALIVVGAGLAFYLISRMG